MRDEHFFGFGKVMALSGISITELLTSGVKTGTGAVRENLG
jgi:hypothetical protein